MKQFYICLLLLAVAIGYSQEKEISSELSIAVKESNNWKAYSFSAPDLSFYSRSYSSTSADSDYTSDMLDRGVNKIYVDGEKFYSATYVPIFLQQQQSNLAVDNYYRMEKMYAQPDPVSTPRNNK